MKTLSKVSILAAFASLLGFGQLTTTQTTLTNALTGTGNNSVVCVGSATGVNLPSVGVNGTYLGIEGEATQVVSLQSTLCYNVKRGQLGTGVKAHNAASIVWVGNAATGTGDPSRPFSGGAFVTGAPSGACTASQQYTLPVIVYGPANGVGNGLTYSCGANGLWGRLWSFTVSPTSCAFTPTTSTVTNTYVLVGASTVNVLNGTTNAAAGTTTLVCDFNVPTLFPTSSPAVLNDITLFVGSQTTAPTSLGTSTLGTVAFPAASLTETASTVTPVAAGGTVTTVSPTAITTVTTAGAFLTLKHTYASAVKLNADLQKIHYTMPFLQSAAAIMTLNTPGLIVHYIQAQ